MLLKLARTLLPALLVLSSVAACQDRGSANSPPAQSVADKSYSNYLGKLEGDLVRLQARVAETTAQRDAVPPRDLFNGWLQHARLSGQVQSYLNARQALDILTERVGDAACNEQARFALAIHRPARAAAALEHCAATPEGGLRADIAYFQGHYTQALELAIQSLNEKPAADNFIRLSRLRMAMGSPQEAAALMEAAEKRYYNGSPHQLAWFKLQRGLIALHSGEFERARGLYKSGLLELDGWWLLEEHLAEVYLLLGNTDDAQRLYDAVVSKTGFADLLDARAKMYEAARDSESANAMLALAKTRYQEDIARFPEAMMGHALSFYLDHGPADDALVMARSEYAQRTDGDTAILLARALMQAGAVTEAIQTLESQLAAGWSTAEAHYILSMAYKKQGDEQASAQHSALALRLNPAIRELLGIYPVDSG